MEKLTKLAEEIHDMLVQVGIKAAEIQLNSQNFKNHRDETVWWASQIINNGVNTADDANWLIKKAIWQEKTEKVE